MKLVGIGDIHGREAWKDVNPDSYDKIIFIGDYSDSHDLHPVKILQNLSEIIELKKQYPEKVVLLLGNHDIQYSEFPHYKCSGFNRKFQQQYTDLFHINKDLFQVAYQTGNRLFTHAGISDHYAMLNLTTHYEEIIKHSIDVASLLNEIHNSHDQPVLHTIGPIRGGYEPYGGITWADYQETCSSILPGYHQVVGHTPRKEITIEGNEAGSVTYIDVLGTRKQFWTTDLPD